MTIAQQLASFVSRAAYEDLSENARLHLKMRVLDSVACAIGAIDGEPVRLLRKHIEDLGAIPTAP
jgi:2-methylcitrate dehydratase